MHPADCAACPAFGVSSVNDPMGKSLALRSQVVPFLFALLLMLVPAEGAAQAVGTIEPGGIPDARSTLMKGELDFSGQAKLSLRVHRSSSQAGVHVPPSVVSDSAASARKSPGRALTYSLSGTVLLAPLFGTGLVAGPAAGHFYAGNARQAWTGIAIRSGAYLTAGLGMGLVWGSTQPTGFKDYPDGGYDPDPPLGDGARKAGIALTVAGMAALLGSASYDIATAWDAAKEHNRVQEVQAQVAPAVGPRGEQVGLSLRFRF
jgi:hypothetical protein